MSGSFFQKPLTKTIMRAYWFRIRLFRIWTLWFDESQLGRAPLLPKALDFKAFRMSRPAGTHRPRRSVWVLLSFRLSHILSPGSQWSSLCGRHQWCARSPSLELVQPCTRASFIRFRRRIGSGWDWACHGRPHSSPRWYANRVKGQRLPVLLQSAKLDCNLPPRSRILLSLWRCRQVLILD